MNPEEENERLKEENKSLKKELEKLRKEFEEYKTTHTRTVSELRKALKIKPNLTSNPAVGARKGHKGYGRHIPERIDQIKELNLKRCPHCKTKLGETQEIRSRHIIDIKLTSKVKTTRFDIHRKYCPQCKKLVEPRVNEALPHARF